MAKMAKFLAVLVIVLVLGITAMALAISPWDNAQVYASVQQVADDNTQAYLGSAAVDHGGGGVTSTHNTTATLTVLRYGEEGPGFVPAYHLIFPIDTQSGSILNDRFDITDLSGVLPSSRVSHDTGTSIVQRTTPARINAV